MAYKEKYPSELLSDAVEAIGTLPGVGRRSALRLALHLLRQPQENVHHFTEAINRLRDDVCSFCADRSRDHSAICVVESVRDVMSIENTGQYHGVYHVLGGIISPIAGIGPSDLSIPELVRRVEALEDPAEAEVIFALSGDVEGESTAFYLYRKLSHTGVRFSTLARGLGFGDDLEYADELTLGRSITARQEFKP